MQSHHASQNKFSAHKSKAPTSNFLASRPFAVQAKPEETERSQQPQGYESQMPDFAILNHDRGRTVPMQFKLAIGAPGDKYEQEADQTAKQVVKLINAPASAQSNQGQSKTLQAKHENTLLQRQEESKTPNLTGLPDDLKAGVENLSGYSLNNVRVHYNSPKPAQLQALAYTQGTEIHVAPGQEEHLSHEAWHVVQQMQGRVKPTMQMNGAGINDELRLEREADIKGEQAHRESVGYKANPKASGLNVISQGTSDKAIQRTKDPTGNDITAKQIYDDIVLQANQWAANGYPSNDGQGFNYNTGWQQPSNGNPSTTKADRKWLQGVLNLSGGQGWKFKQQVVSKSSPDDTNDFLLSDKTDPKNPVNFNYHVIRE